MTKDKICGILLKSIIQWHWKTVKISADRWKGSLDFDRTREKNASGLC